MSESIVNALRPEIDRTISDFIDACVAGCDHRAQSEIESLARQLEDTKTKLKALEDKLSKHDAALKELSKETPLADPTDKYALTKAKMVKLMVDMGYLK